MREFSKQLKFVALVLILGGSLGLTLSTSKVALLGIANAAPTPDPNCPTISTNFPLKGNEAYGFYAFGADASAGTNATVTMNGDIETDNNGCIEEAFFTVNDNGFPCTSTFTSVMSANTSPPKTGSMTWTSAACFGTPLGLHWANAAGKDPKVMYFSSDGSSSALVVAGKLEDNGGSDGPVLTGTGGAPSALQRKHRH